MAATSSSITSAFALLKEHYLKPDVIKNVMLPAGPLCMQLLERADTSCGGKTIPFPIITSNGGGVGSSYAAIYASSGPAQSSVFQLTRGTTYAFYLIGGEVMDSSESNSDAFIKDVTLEVDVKQKAIRQMMAQYIYGDGSGVMAQLNSGITVSSTTVSLADATTALKFKVGDAIQISATWGGAARAGGPAYVVAVSPFTTPAYLNVSATLGGAAADLNSIFAAAAAGDYVVFNGDQGEPSSSGGSGPQIPQGIMAWAGGWGGPQNGDSFFGLDRVGNFNLYCQILDQSPSGANVGSIRAALVLGVGNLLAIGAEPTAIFMNPVGFQRLVEELNSGTRFSGSDGNGPGRKGALGFSELELPTPAGMIRVVSDPQCMPAINANYFSAVGTTYSAAKLAFILEEDTWEVVSKGEVPQLDERDGLYFVRQPSLGDVFAGQLVAYWQLGSHAPSHNLIELLP